MSVADPITWQIILLIASRLSEIRQANGYYTDVGRFVFTERAQVPQGAEQFVVVTMAKTTRTGTGPKIQRTADFIVEAGIPLGVDETNKMFVAHRLLADLERALNTRASETIAGVRYALAADAQIEETPDGLNAVAVTLALTAGYMPILA
jgi:hypothetical protein